MSLTANNIASVEKANGRRGAGLVVLIESDAALRKAYADSLTNLGFMVVSTAGGEEGMSMLFSNVPKLLILDVVLPDIDGIEVCRRAREILGDQVSIIFLSTLDNLEVVQLCLEAGGNDFLIKDSNLEKFEDRVIYWANAGTVRRREKHRSRTLAAVRAAVQERETEADGGGGLSSDTDPDVAEMSRFIDRAREAAGAGFGKSIEEKLYLIGYTAGVVNYWTTLKLHMKSKAGQYLRAVLRETEILSHDEINLLLEAWDELAQEPVFADAINKGTFEAVARTQKGRHFTPVALVKFGQSTSNKEALARLSAKLMEMAPQSAA